MQFELDHATQKLLKLFVPTRFTIAHLPGLLICFVEKEVAVYGGGLFICSRFIIIVIDLNYLNWLLKVGCRGTCSRFLFTLGRDAS